MQKQHREAQRCVAALHEEVARLQAHAAGAEEAVAKLRLRCDDATAAAESLEAQLARAEADLAEARAQQVVPLRPLRSRPSHILYSRGQPTYLRRAEYSCRLQ